MSRPVGESLPTNQGSPDGTGVPQVEAIDAPILFTDRSV